MIAFSWHSGHLWALDWYEDTRIRIPCGIKHKPIWSKWKENRNIVTVCVCVLNTNLIFNLKTHNNINIICGLMGTNESVSYNAICVDEFGKTKKLILKVMRERQQKKKIMLTNKHSLIYIKVIWAASRHLKWDPAFHYYCSDSDLLRLLRLLTFLIWDFVRYPLIWSGNMRTNEKKKMFQLWRRSEADNAYIRLSSNVCKD